MKYEIDKSYDFRVVDSPTDNEVYFGLETETSAGETAIVDLKKLAFQRAPGYKRPATLNCRVRSFDENGLPVLAPNIASYVYSLYSGAYARGESFECEVISAPDSPSEEPYTIADRHGIFFRLDAPDAMLSKGQKVRCRLTRLTQRYFNLTRVDEGAHLTFFSPEALLLSSVGERHITGMLHKMLRTLPEMATARAELTCGRPSWPLTAARTALEHLPEWFLSSDLRRHNKLLRKLIKSLRAILLHLLEGSSFLNAASSDQRFSLQKQLTDFVDSLEPYDLTLTLIRDGSEDTFVESLMDKLQKSGYLYHPARQFAVLMLIFRLHPDKVANYLSRIFDSIFGRDLENWKREPFRSAFVEQFQIYVRQTRQMLDQLPLAESREQKARIETVVLAIALQLLLKPDNDGCARSWSLFYRYVSLLRPLKNEELLTKSFLALMGADVNTRFTYSQLKEPMMMMTQATVMPSDDIFSKLTATHSYANNGIEIAISPEGLTIRPQGRPDITERVIPDGLMPWLKPRLLVNGVRSLGGPRIRKLADHHQWWHDIETNLSETQTVRTTVEPAPEPRQRIAAAGDQVYIVVDKVLDSSSNNPTFVCHISDEEFQDGTGLMPRDRIVGFNLRQPPMEAFQAPDGSPLGFLATVDDVNADGTYVFSLLNEVDRFIDENLNYYDEYTAVVTGSAEYDLSAISSLGIGLYLQHDNTRYNIGDIVKFKLRHIGHQGQIKGYITGPASEDHEFGKTEAFTYLMQSIGVSGNAGAEHDDDGELVRDIDEILTPEHIREIIEIIRFKAIAESELIKAYDYLRLARLLAMAIGDQKLADMLLTHASLLSQHQFFATNSRIDPDKLEALQAEASADPLLRMIYHRLEMVSWLGRQERTPELYATVSESTNELEVAIARMVLAYNMVQIGESDSSLSTDIKRKIMEKLNVNNETRQGKYYGSESKYLEFKTSIVYPATAPGEEMREDPQAQQFHILSRIAGLLNANGGRLYLGVNNDGFEVGLHDDFRYFERHTVYAHNYPFKITNLDKLTVFLEELINQNFDRRVGRKIEVSVDSEAEKGVILFNVDQSLEPVFLDGRLFVRQSGQSTREYKGSDIDDFVKERALMLAEHRRMLEIDNSAPAPEEPEAPAPEEALATETPAPKVLGAPEAETMESLVTLPACIGTSHWRPNVLHNYEAGFVNPFGYLYFMTDDTLMFSRTDLYLDSDVENCMLALTVPHELAEHGYLLLGFTGEKALKIPLAEIYASCGNAPQPIGRHGDLMFAAIAGRDDALICVGADSGGSLSRRATKVSQIDQGRLNSIPKRLHDATVHHTVAYEIADASAIDSLSDCLADKMTARRFGMTMRVNESSPDADFKLNDLFNKCAQVL